LAGTGSYGRSQQPESMYSLENLMKDIQRDPQHSAEYMRIHEYLNKQAQSQGMLSLSDTAIERTTDAQKALEGLSELEQIVGGDFAGGVIQGQIQQFNPFNDEFKNQQSSIDRVRQTVGKALEGGVLRAEDEAKYRKILPTMQDSPEGAQYKINKLRQMIREDMQRYLVTQQRYGKGAGQVNTSDSQTLLAQ